MYENRNKIISLSDGIKTSIEISEILGLSSRYVRKIQQKFDLPRLSVGPRLGEKNHAFLCGRKIDRDGYALVSAPQGHPYARIRQTRNVGIIFQHRLVLEKTLCRYLLQLEGVEHKDGLTLHNDPSNLRLFDKNGIFT